MQERGVDIALGVGVANALYQRSQGADLFIVGGWRLEGPAGTRWYARPGTELTALRGTKAGIRELGSMNGEFLKRELVHRGIRPGDAVSWVFDPIFYGANPKALEALSDGRVDMIALRPGSWHEAEKRGFTVLLDTAVAYPGGRPGKVIVATGATLRERSTELGAFLRANLRAFWFVRDAANFAYIKDLDARSRAQSHNVDERRAGKLVTVVADIETWPMPLDGGVPRDGLERILNEQLASGSLEHPLALDDVLREDLISAAYDDLSGRPASLAALANNRRLLDTYGF
jgi:ABC-type nitrate/sulfonate/bicarbonate transport system substrate-binding protein